MNFLKQVRPSYFIFVNTEFLVKEALNIVTFNPDLEQMLISMSKEHLWSLIDPNLAKQMIKSILD